MWSGPNLICPSCHDQTWCRVCVWCTVMQPIGHPQYTVNEGQIIAKRDHHHLFVMIEALVCIWVFIFKASHFFPLSMSDRKDTRYTVGGYNEVATWERGGMKINECVILLLSLRETFSAFCLAEWLSYAWRTVYCRGGGQESQPVHSPSLEMLTLSFLCLPLQHPLTSKSQGLVEQVWVVKAGGMRAVGDCDTIT